MSLKRLSEDGNALCGDDNGGSEIKRRRVPAFTNVVLEVMKMQSVQNLLGPVLEPLIRRVVKEEVELALRKHLNNIKRNCGKEMRNSESRTLKLQFLNTVSLPVFTGTRIEGEECSNLRIALIDTITGQIYESGSELSSKVEIVVLEGDFDGDENEDWTQEEFKNNIVREREGKKPLLSGDVIVMLNEGIGLVGEISFTDNSSWTRSRKFRLGARVVGNDIDGIRTREAKSESFIVRDHRGELYKKHHPPSMFDEVWRLEKIGKDGAFHKRLSRENINTVKDFLTLLFIDSSRLRNILGTGMSAKMWEVTLEHAQTCVLDKRLYLYWSHNSSQKYGLVFNVVGQVLGLILEGQYVLVDKLSETQKVDAHNLVISAFQHWEEVQSLDEETFLASQSLQITSCSGNKTENPNNITDFEDTQRSYMLSSVYSITDINNLDDLTFNNIGPRFDSTINVPSCGTGSMIRDFYDDDLLRFFDFDDGSDADLHSAVSSFLRTKSVDKAQRRWTKISSVLKWFSIRKIVSLRKIHFPRRN